MQILQNKAARETKVKYEDADHLGLFCQLGWLTVRGLIKLDLGIFMYKSQNNLFPETAGKFHIPAEMVHSYETRSAVSGNVLLPRYELSFTQKYIAFNGAKIWNEIQVNIKKAPSINSFRKKNNLKHITCRLKKKFKLFALSEHRSIPSKERRTAQYHML